MTLLSLQEKANLTVFRKCEIKRRTTSGYESSWFDVSDLVTRWPSIKTEIDALKPFTYRRSNAQMAFRNDDGQFSKQTFSESIFKNATTRYKTLCRVSTGLLDEDGAQLPADDQVFIGLFTDNVIDGIVETNVTINDVIQSLAEFPASNIAPSVSNLTLTSSQILGTIRDYTDANGTVVLDSFLSSGAWLLSQTGRFYEIGTSTNLDGKSALDLITDLALAENHVFYLDSGGNLRFTDREANTTTSIYDFNGPSERNVNIGSINNVNEGVYKVFNKFTLTLNDDSVVSTQQSFTVGDGTSSWLYGQREFAFKNDFVVTTVAGSICSQLLDEFTNPKQEIEFDCVKYVTQLDINDRVTFTYRGEPGGDGSLWGGFLWGHGLWSGYRGGINIKADFKIISKTINMDNFRTAFQLRGV